MNRRTVSFASIHRTPRLDAKRALLLLRLVGHAYVDHLIERFGADPVGWRPSGMRRKYERYQPALPPKPFRLLSRLHWKVGTDDFRSIGLLFSRGLSRYLIFRGTLTESEWFRDMQVAQCPCPADAGVGVEVGRVHRGFARIYSGLSPAPAELDLRPRSGGHLYIAGHSLGGALAVMAALEVRTLAPRVYTLGTPRIGDPQFQETVERLVPYYRRIENFWDPVTDLPREETNLLLREYRYRHAGHAQTVFALSQAGGDSLAERVRARVDPLAFLRQGGDIDPLFTHQLSAYEHALGKLLGP